MKDANICSNTIHIWTKALIVTVSIILKKYEGSLIPY